MPASLSASTHDPAPAQAPRAPLARGRRPRCADALRTRGRSQAAARYHGPVRPRQPATGTAAAARYRYGRGGSPLRPWWPWWWAKAATEIYTHVALRPPRGLRHTISWTRYRSLGHAIALFLFFLYLSSSLPSLPPTHSCPSRRGPSQAAHLAEQPRRERRGGRAESGAGDVPSCRS